MTTTLLRQALDALTMPCDRWNYHQAKIVSAAIDALTAHLAQPEWPAPTGKVLTLADSLADLAGTERPAAQPQAEPVAWAMPRADGLLLDVICPDEHEAYAGEYTVPLYLHHAAPAPAQCAQSAEVDMLPGECWINLEAQAMRARDAAAPAPAVPTGYVLVPVEPNDDMLIAGQEAWAVIKPRRNAIEDCKEADAVYRAMIAAAPPPPPLTPLTDELDKARADSDRRHQLLIIQHAEAVDLWNALKDLSFECDGVTYVKAPSRETYNRTFALLRKKNHLSPEALRGYGESGVMQQSVQFSHGIKQGGRSNG